MRTIDAIKHYKTEYQLAKELDISRQAVSKWGDLVPIARAYEIERISGGAVKVKPRLYAKTKKHS